MKKKRKQIKRVVLLMMTMILAGCVTTKFHETVVDADGGSAETQYSAHSSAWPFGKLETANHTWHYGWGLDTAQNEISTGQNAAGFDNTGMTALADIIAKVVIETLKAYMVMPATPTQPSVVPQILDALEPLLKQ